MERLRRISALLACLAAFATGLPAFASVAAAVQSGVAVSQVSSHCQDCRGCHTDRCTQMVDCMVPCTPSIPGLVALPIEVSLVPPSDLFWPAPSETLTGERPPPDPLPPRS